MKFAQVVVNVPIRRTFSRRHAEPPPPEAFSSAGSMLPADDAFPNNAESRADFRLFDYHIPVDLERTLAPGHLVWVPFGAQKLQGFVVRRTESSSVPTKPIDHLARPDAVLTEAQIELAFWIADYYLAPISEAIKLFLPPGLLSKSEASAPVRLKREHIVELVVAPDEIGECLATVGRDTQQARVLSYLIFADGLPVATDALRVDCGLSTNSAINTLAKRELIEFQDQRRQVALAVPTEEARRALLVIRGADKFEPVLKALAEAESPLWKSDLYAKTDANLNQLRQLQSAGLIKLTEEVRLRDPLAGKIYPTTKAPSLTEHQRAVWKTIEGHGLTPHSDSADGDAQDRHATFLLHGVTGSGKTEIYLRAIERVLAAGRQAIVLVPEIALTPQTVARFAGRFPGRVTVVHSGLSRGERYDVWRSIRDGLFDIVVGPRSALFVPMARLGLIVIDEEHEASYKQDAEAWGSFTVFYDARRVAQHLAELTGSTLILGSATPSLEAYSAALQGGTTLLELPRRVIGHGNSPVDGATPSAAAAEPKYSDLPPVEIVDMRQELRAGNRSIFSRSLQAELHATLDAGEQVILFLNRRGAKTFVMCRDCGDVQQCPRCEVPLTYHERATVLICHHCDRRYPIPTVCPECESKRIKYFGAGTQRVEEFVREIAPRARLLRWDADTTGRKGSHEAILERFAGHEADILIGTQMIAKGLDLPLVTLVGVVSADVGLYLPDFRSGERSFQLLTQVAGRAGRSRRGGRVVIQSYRPEHYAVQAAAQHDYLAFYEREIGFRHEHGYPPAQRLVRLVYWEKNLEKAKTAAAQMSTRLEERMHAMGIDAQIAMIGPAPAFFARYRGYYRWQILLRSADPSTIVRGLEIPFGWRVDVDPVSIL